VAKRQDTKYLYSNLQKSLTVTKSVLLNRIIGLDGFQPLKLEIHNPNLTMTKISASIQFISPFVSASDTKVTLQSSYKATANHALSNHLEDK